MRIWTTDQHTQAIRLPVTLVTPNNCHARALLFIYFSSGKFEMPTSCVINNQIEVLLKTANVVSCRGDA